MTRFVQKFAAHRLCDTVLINVKPPAWERKGSPEGTRRESEAYLLSHPYSALQFQHVLRRGSRHGSDTCGFCADDRRGTQRAKAHSHMCVVGADM